MRRRPPAQQLTIAPRSVHCSGAVCQHVRVLIVRTYNCDSIYLAELCSKEGGRPFDTNLALRGTNYDPGVPYFRPDPASGTSVQQPSTKRYYYDPTDGQCHDFTYTGLLGNFNNFLSSADCQNFCARRMILLCCSDAT